MKAGTGRGSEIAAIVRMIREKQARLNALEREARALRSQLAAVRASVSARATPARGPRVTRPAPRRRPVWPSSIAGRALTALQQAGRPLRVERLLHSIERASGRKIARATLVGQLARDVRSGRLFRRTAPNEYALAEWKPRRRSG